MWRIAILAVATAQAIISAAAIANQPEVTIGIYGTGGVGGGHILAKSQGFNTVILPPSRQVLKEIAGLGLKAIVKFSLLPGDVREAAAFQNYLDKLGNSVRDLKGEGVVVAWYVGDEPDGLGIPPDVLRGIHEKVKAADPVHPTFAVFNRPDKWKPYLSHVDIVGIDPYLRQTVSGIRSKTVEYENVDVVDRWISAVRRDLNSVGLKRPLWTVLQAFEYRYIDPSVVSPYRAATIDDLDRMIQIAVKRCVDGVLFYTMGFPAGVNQTNGRPYRAWNLPLDRPDLWDYLKGIDRINSQLAQECPRAP